MAYNRFLGQNGFRGVDLTSHPSLVHPDRLADAVNVWKDYKSGQGSAIETFPGYREVFKVAGEKVNGIFRFRSGVVDCLLLHIGEDLYSFAKDHNRKINFNNVVKLKNAKSSGFQFGDKFYIIDGQGYYRVIGKSLDSLSLYKYSDNDQAYIPTTFINGTEHEQRNMLVDKEVQEYGPLSVAGSTGGYDFSFSDFNDQDKTCKVSKCTVTTEETVVVVVPSTHNKGGIEYTVTGVAQFAFSNIGNIEEVILPGGVTSIGGYAFKDCIGLKKVYFSATDELRTISAYAFMNCANLEAVYVSYGKESTGLFIGKPAFGGCKTGVKIIQYDPNDNAKIYWDGSSSVDPEITVDRTTQNLFYTPEDIKTISIPIYSPCLSVEKVEINGKTVTVESQIKDGDYIKSVSIKTDISYLGGIAKLTIVIDPSKFASSKYTSYLSTQSGYGGTAQEAILGCTICAQFDGRVFFTGNPALPNTVFYTQRDDTGHNNPFYIGTYNYFDTGIGQTPNSAMIATGSNLIVFKGDTVQDGSINLYQGVDGTDNILPRFYVRQQGLAGVGCLGAACNFADDPVFISKRGLDAVGLQTVNLERSVQHRSTNVDRKLTSEALAHAQLTEWEGYLVLLVPGGRVYLADSRQLFTNAAGYMEYEWYFLDDIGAYEGDDLVYAFSSVLPVINDEVKTEVGGKPLNIYHSPDTIVSGEVGSVGDGNQWVGYVDIDDVRYSVYKTGEKIGGTFSPATCIVGIDDYLIFGTENGAICVFNTDKRGTMEANDQGIDTKDIIPREWFSHMGHRYLSTIILALENAGVPNMAKNTVKRTVVLKAKDIFGSVFKWNVRTDRKVFGTNPDVTMAKGEISNAVTDLDFLEFQYINFDTSYDGALIVLNEKKKRYVEKQYAFFSDGYCRPFGVYNIAYQYEIQGKVKNR